MYLEISLLFLSAAVLLIVVFAVPVLIQVHRLAKSVAVTHDLLQARLPAMLDNLEDTIATIRRTAHTVNDQVDSVNAVVGRIQTLGQIARQVDGILQLSMRFPVVRAAKTLLAILKGVGVFVRVYAERHGR